jgi:hypothetical protein
MLKGRVLAIAGVALVSLGVAVGAAAQQTKNEHPPSTTAMNTSSKTTMQIEGCVFPKEDLSDMKPPFVTAASVMDYVLTDTNLLTAAPGVMVKENQIFDLTGPTQDRLRALIGKRVGVTGHVQSKSPYSVMEVTSIRPISGECPYKPTHQGS